MLQTDGDRNFHGLESEFGKPETSAAGREILESLINISKYMMVILCSEAVKSHLMSL